jgi:putative membrane protein
MWDYGMHGWGWWGALVMGGFVLLVVVGVVALALALGRTGQQVAPHERGASEAERLLDERFARGEIDEEEYLHRRAVLRGR